MAGDTRAAVLRGYATRFEASWARAELHRVRNFRQGFAGGFWSGMMHTGFQMISGGRGLFERRRIEPDFTHMRRRQDLGGRQAPAPVTLDEKLTFKKLSDVYLSGTTHDEDAHIPLVWYGWGIKKGSTSRETYMTDIAVTLAPCCTYRCPAVLLENQ